MSLGWRDHVDEERPAGRSRARVRQLLAADQALRDTAIGIGVASWRPGLTPDDILAEADRDVYSAKPQGIAAS